jgi:hypothetical protein
MTGFRLVQPVRENIGLSNDISCKMIGTIGLEQWVCKYTDVRSQTEGLRSLPQQASAAKAGKGTSLNWRRETCCVEAFQVDNL